MLFLDTVLDYDSLFSDGVVMLSANESVTEGDNVTVCVHLICSDAVLGCPLEVTVNASDGKAGKPMT